MKIIVFVVSICHFCYSQTNNNTYLYFDKLSGKTYTVEINGKKENEKFYSKGVKRNGDITFHIGKEMFLFLRNKNKVDSCKIEHLKSIKLSDVDNLVKVVNKINPLYPHKVFPNLFLVEKLNDSIVLKYKVKWEYYIE
ncbi:hypothetical protein [Hyunsoonleella rubra]|uniref:Uncharacterized protein n=1 Tax=Hyunsoonleella rubra TaxID=1737062 RepID=A0ABW5TEA0_9FLAO